MNRWWMHLLVFAAGMGVVALAYPRPGRHALEAIYQDLGLTQTVAEDMRKLDAAVGPRCTALAQKRRELYEAMRQEPHDPTAVQRLTGELAAIRNEIQAAVIEHLLAVKPKLTPEQRTALFDRLAAGEGRP